MPKYLGQINYVGDGVNALLEGGGTARLAAATELIESLGGKIEAFYYAYGEYDLYTIVDMPDSASMTAASLTVAASGTATVKTTVLLTPEELDQASKKSPTYSAPGQ